MKKKLLMLFSLLLCSALSSCDFDSNNISGIQEVTKLPTPNIREVLDNYVYWDEVPNASSYIIKINSYQENAGNQLKYSISSIMDNRIESNVPTELHIYVKANGNQILYSDSDWSSEYVYTYTKKTNVVSKTKLDWPTNIQMENSIISWDEVPNANGYQLRIEGDSNVYSTARTQYDVSSLFNETTEFKVQLKSVASEFSNYSDSDWTVVTPLKYEKAKQSAQIGFNDTYKSNGLGRTIDLINADSYKPKNGTGYIFDEEALFDRTLVEESIGDQKATYEYGTSFESFYNKWKVDIGAKVSSKIDGANYFPASAEFNVEVKSGYEQVRKEETNELYIKMHHNIVGKSVEIMGHASDYDYFASILSDNFKNSAKKVVDERTAEQFINAWGTHVIMGAYYGAAFEATYYNISHSSNKEDNWYVDIETAVKSHLFFMDASAESSTELDIATKGDSKNTLIKFEAHAVGGNGVALASDLAGFQSAYKDWAGSLSESKYTLIDFPENSLYCIWDFLDDSTFSSQKEILNNYFMTHSQKKLNEIQSKLSNIYNKTKVDFDISSYGHGEVSVISVNGEDVTSNQEFLVGDLVKVKATPQDGYKFSNWEVVNGDDSYIQKNNSITEFSLLGDTSLKALFYIQSELEDYSFTATIKTTDCKSKTIIQGDANFTMKGIHVAYDNKEYIYGNAYFVGSVGGSRLNNIARMSLVLDKNALFGGFLSWSGSQGDSNESGSAAWDATNDHNTNEIYYLQRYADNDFAGNEEVKISIIGICVQIGELAKDKESYPEMVKLENAFTADFYTENTSQGKAYFDMYGIKTIYGNAEYIFGCAYNNKRIYGTYFRNIDEVSLRNSSKEFLNGGTMVYRGTLGNYDQSGLYSNYEIKNEGKDCYYMAENGDNDFAGDRYVIFSITNICIKLNDNIKDDEKYLRLREAKVEAEICAELTSEVSTKEFSIFGIDVSNKDKNAILGYASYSGKFTGARVNDCDSMRIRFDNKIAVFWGTLHYIGDYENWDTQGSLTSYSSELTSELIYYADNCADDFPGKKVDKITIFINGICMNV